MSEIILREHESNEVNLSITDVDLLRKSFSTQLEVWPTTEPGKYLIKAKSYVGIIILPSGQKIIIEPKIPVQTLFAILARVYDPEKEYFQDLVHPFTTINDLFEFIVSFFCAHTEDLIKRGLLRGYQSHTEDLQMIRGRLLILETLHRSPGVYDSHWCSFRNFTPDIKENRVLLWTAYVLHTWDFSDPILFNRIHRIQQAMAHVLLDPDARLLLDGMEFHRLNDTYKPALTLARLILDHLAFTGITGNEPFKAYLINMNTLFQDYLAVVIDQGLESKGFRVKTTEQHKLDKHNKVNIEPDILIYDKVNPVLVVDAKYKLNKAEDDLYQMLAYCHTLDLPQGILIHPESETAPAGSIEIRGAGEILVDYLSLDLNGTPEQLKENAAILVEKIKEYLVVTRQVVSP